jgi:phage terminase small subunit
MAKEVKKAKRAGSLNVRQARFVLEYLKDGNGTQAAIRAGYVEHSAYVHASYLLKLPKVRDKISVARDEMDRELNLSVERVLREYARIAFLDPADLFDAAGQLLPLKEMPADARRALSGIEVEEMFDFERGSKTQVGTLRKVRFASKILKVERLRSNSIAGIKHMPVRFTESRTNVGGIK